jgi:hypothetical protein
MPRVSEQQARQCSLLTRLRLLLQVCSSLGSGGSRHATFSQYQTFLQAYSLRNLTSGCPSRPLKHGALGHLSSPQQKLFHESSRTSSISSHVRDSKISMRLLRRLDPPPFSRHHHRHAVARLAPSHEPQEPEPLSDPAPNNLRRINRINYWYQYCTVVCIQPRPAPGTA